MRFARWSAFVAAVGLLLACTSANEPVATPTTPTTPTTPATPATPMTPGSPVTPTTVSSASTAPESTVPTTVAPEPIAPWGEGARAWFDALELAATNGLVHLGPFIAPGLVWEQRLGEGLIRGSQDWFDFHTDADLFEIFLPRGAATYFVSADEAMRQQVVTFEVPKAVSLLDRMEIGPDGLRHWIRAGSIAGGRWYQPQRSDYDGFDALVDRYLALWNGSADADVASVYQEDAVVWDTLLGRSVSGVAAIGRAVDSGSWPATGTISISQVPEGGGRAVHLAPSSDVDGMGPEEVRLVIDVDDGTGCPGLSAVALVVDGDRVRQEHRYHDIDSVRRCYEPATLRPGWWEGLAIPAPVSTERTGTVTFGDQTIEILNGTPELERFLEWGLARFEEAGLPVPRVASVTFLDARAACYNVGGLTQTTSEGADVTLCRTMDDVCIDDACRTWASRDRQLLLHELAHAWLVEHTDDAVRAEFLDLVEQPRWSDASDPWPQRGVEWAADALAYGLMDVPVDIAPELATTCDDRAAGFRVLTGAAPLNECER